MELTIESRSSRAARAAAPSSPSVGPQSPAPASGVPTPHAGAVQRTAEIACTAPFELRHSLAFLRHFRPTAGEQTIERGVLGKAIVLAGRPLGVRVFQPRGGGGALASKLRVALVSEQPVDDATAAAAIDRIAFFLSADEDLAEFYAIAENDGAFADAARRLRGFHHVKLPSPFEAACWAVLNQRIGMTVARRMKDALVARLGSPVDLEDGTHRAFPDADAVAGLGEAELAALFGNDRKAKAVSAIARAFAGVSDDFLRHAPEGEVKAWLERIYGVGRFTTGFVMFRGLGRLDRLPEAPEFVAAARAAYGRPVAPDELAATARRYGRWAGHWMLYVWASRFPAASGAHAAKPA
jgi:DNA-3-methyladenine glycosylase II